ncbi:GrpB family protein [Neobacillus sp. YIM B06451]|uniref:GrpB family protein n=1 Tax=Neobacillus sp. YIM B06451 TaxID=3070994 RepID=UPI00292EB44F|nr:GrpB family protein [Neobacillus sp. YIM B06451]
MKLGLKSNEVRVVPYDPEWKKEFTKVKKNLMQHTNLQDNQIEHIGSTAITGIHSKPIIDILVGIGDYSSVSDSLAKGLQKAGFYRLRVERPNEIVFAKFTDNSYEVKTHFIHLVDFGGELWNHLIFFRDYLNSNEEAKREYEELKLEYTRQTSQGINEYTDHKEAFVKKIFAMSNSKN